VHRSSIHTEDNAQANSAVASVLHSDLDMRRLEQHTHFLAWLCSALQCKARRACKACKACKARQASTHLCHPAGRLSEGSIRPLHVLTHLLPSFCPLLPDGARDQSRHLIRRQLLHMHTLTSCASIRRAIWAMCVGLLSRGRCWLCTCALILTNSKYLCRSPRVEIALVLRPRLYTTNHQKTKHPSMHLFALTTP